MEKDVSQDVKVSGKILYRGNLPEFLSEISLYFLLSLCRLNFTGGGVKGKRSPGLNLPKDIPVGREIFP